MKLNENGQTNWRQPNPRMNTTTQQPRAIQKINQIGDQLDDDELTHSGEDEESPQEEQHIPDDLISISSHTTDGTTASAFLDE